MSEIILRKGEGRALQIENGANFMRSLSQDCDWVMTVEKLKKKRSDAQNRLQQQWHQEAALELKDEPAEDKRAYCKAFFGVPILRAENEKFRVDYDRVIRPLPYETKLALMKEPFDFPVTRLMTTDQKRRYLDAVWTHYTSQGVRLTDPSLQGAA
jgi:hypothetical protein